MKSNNSNILVLTLNIKSVRNKIDELLVFLECQNNPDLVLLTEHWLECWEPFSLENYYIVTHYCRENSSGYGGTIILIKKSFSLNFQLEAVSGFDNLCIEREFEFSVALNKKHKLYLICIYRPPGTNITSFLIRLESLLLSLPTNCKIILTGDLNINYINNQCAGTLALKNLLRSYGLVMFVNSPTRITDKSATVIDYFCTNLNQDSVNCDVIATPGLSDHEALLAGFSVINKTESIPSRCGRIFSRKNFAEFGAECGSVDWKCVLDSEKPLEKFHFTLHSCFDTSFPLRRMRAKKHKKAWITGAIKRSSQNLKSLSYIKKFTNNINFITYFNKYRKIYKKVLKTAKHNFYRDRMSGAENAAKEAWSIVNDLRGKTSYAKRSAEVSPNDFNEFYCSIALKISESIDPSTDPLSYLNKAYYVNETFILGETNVEELKTIIYDIKKTNSAGVDEIPVKVFRNLDDGILLVLAQCINICFAMGEFPDFLKIALVIPLHKTGTYTDPANFRPISLLTTLSKIIEKIVKKRLVIFLNRHSVVSDSQYGFQSGKGTNDAVFSFLESLYLKLNEREVAAAVFCDFSKAFDCVRHDILLKKMFFYGIRETSYKFFDSYMSKRGQMVKNNNLTSSFLPISTGVPQGSVLGPVLFLIYIEDLLRLPIKGKFTAFADDVTPFWHHRDSNILREIVSHDLQEIKLWCDANYLSLNVEKTKILSFRFVFDNLQLNNQPIDLGDNTKFLGMQIDSNLKFHQHIVSLNKKISSGAYAVRRTCSGLGPSMAKATYYALVESHLRYGIAFWGNCSQYLFRSVFAIQKRCVRYICGVGLNEHCRPLFKKENILTLVCLFILETVCLMHKKYKGVSNAHSYLTRNYNRVPLPIPKYSLTQNSLIYRSVKMYNKLPSFFRDRDYKNFRENVRLLLIDKAYYELEEYLIDTF